MDITTGVVLSSILVAMPSFIGQYFPPGMKVIAKISQVKNAFLLVYRLKV